MANVRSRKQAMPRTFTPISVDDYIARHLALNPDTSRTELTANLTTALAAFKSGVRCSCGEQIWVIGSAFAGRACFTCISGGADPSGDFEIADACLKT